MFVTLSKMASVKFASVKGVYERVSSVGACSSQIQSLLQHPAPLTDDHKNMDTLSPCVLDTCWGHLVEGDDTANSRSYSRQVDG